MAAPSPTKKVLADLKASILAPAQTSHFLCQFQPPPLVAEWLTTRKSAGLGIAYDENSELFNLSCCDAFLPGSSLATHEINNDYTGVTERHAYRRQYDDRADFTFYVDKDYYVIHLFENWMSYIVNERRSDGLGFLSVDKPNSSYRVQFPKDYQTQSLYITKFEKNYANRSLTYQFVNAFPISINSMPVSYNESQVLKCTVSFSYSRYIVGSELQPSQETTLYRPNNEEPILTRVDDGRPTQAQLVEQLEQAGRQNFGGGILGGGGV